MALLPRLFGLATVLSRVDTRVRAEAAQLPLQLLLQAGRGPAGCIAAFR